MKQRNQNQNIFIIFLSILSIFLYINTLENQFVWDDLKLLRNPLTKDFDLIKIFSTDFWYPTRSGSYRPIAILSYSFNYFLSGNSQNSFIYHSFNIFVYILDVMLVFLIVKEITNSNISFLVSLLFAAHPIHTESVATLFGRPELLYALFILSSFLLHIKNYSFDRIRRSYVYVLSLFLFFLGILSKETAVTLFGFIVLYDLAFRYKIKENSVKSIVKSFYKEFKSKYFGYLVIILLWLSVRIFLGIGSISRGAAFLDNPLLYSSLSERLFTGIKLIGIYILKLTLPLKLSADYSYNQIPLSSSFDPLVILSLVLLTSLFFTFLLSFKKDRLVFFSLGFLLLSLVPISNIFLPIGSIFAERFLFVPSFGFVFLVTSILYSSLKSKRKFLKILIISLIILILSLYSFRTIIRNKDWRDEITLWKKTVKTSPLSAKAHANLGMAYLKQKDYDKAIYELDKALSIYSSYPQAISNLGAAYGMKGDYETSIKILQDGLVLFSDNKDLRSNLATAFYFLGKEKMESGLYEQAEKNFKKALSYNPNLQEALVNLEELRKLKKK